MTTMTTWERYMAAKSLSRGEVAKIATARALARELAQARAALATRRQP